MTDVGAGSSADFEEGRDHVDEVVVLGTNGPLVLDPRGPRDDERVRVPAQVGVLLPLLERRVARQRPAHRVEGIGFGAADLVENLDHLLNRFRVEIAVTVGVGHPVLQPFLGRPVVRHHDDERVVADAQFIERREQPAEVVVGVVEHPSEGFLKPGVNFLLGVVQLRPRLDHRVSWRELGVLRDDAELLLPLEGFLANPVPTLVKPAFVFLDELLRGVQRGMVRAEGEVGEERPPGVGLLLIADVGDGAVHQVFGQVVARTGGGIDEGVVLHQERRPLVGLAAEEAVELVKTHPQRPAIERPGRGVGGVRGQVPFAERHGVVAVLLQRLGDRGGALRDASRSCRGNPSRLR